jgi:hypothetical protein
LAYGSDWANAAPEAAARKAMTSRERGTGTAER